MAYPRQSIELSQSEFAELTRSFFNSPTDSGETVRRFESLFADFIGVGQAIAFASQRAGMYFVLKALDAKPGDEVIVPAYTFFSVPACVLLAGLVPIFVDVDSQTWNLDPSQAKAAITPRTRAIIVTHLNGCPADLDRLLEITNETGIQLIEDCAQALGATYHSKQVGSFGVGCFSFGEGKNLLAMGGGMVTTRDSRLASRLRKITDSFGNPPLARILSKWANLLFLKTVTTPPIFTVTVFPWLYLSSLKNGEIDTDREHKVELMSVASFQERLCNAQAALALAQFESLNERNQSRITNAQTLSSELRGVKGIELPPIPHDRTHLYTHYAIRVRDRERFCKAMIRRGVDAQRDYCSFCPALPDFRSSPNRLKTPVAQALDGTIAYLPNQPQLSSQNMSRIALAVKTVVES